MPCLNTRAAHFGMNLSEWKDITALCRVAAAELTDGNPMTAVAEFSLLDSMSAVEVYSTFSLFASERHIVAHGPQNGPMLWTNWIYRHIRTP